jgi:hypothetical protein
MAKLKYEKYVREMKFGGDDVFKVYPERMKPGPYTWIPDSIVVDGRTWPQATKHLECFIIKEPCGSGVDRVKDPALPPMEMGPGLYAEDDDETPLFSADEGGEVHFHRHEEYYMFLGTNPDDPEDLGGELELWLGIGRYAEKFIITKSTAVRMPPGLAAHPMVFRRVDRPILKIVIYDNPIYSLIPVGILPPGFKP